MTRQLALEQGSDAAEAARLKQLLGSDGSLIELNRALSDKIAKGEVDLQTPGLAEHLWQTTMDKLAVDQPNYASYKRELGMKWIRISVIPRGCVAHGHRDLAACSMCRDCARGSLRIAPAMTVDDGADLYFPSHFGGRFSANAFGPSM